MGLMHDCEMSAAPWLACRAGVCSSQGVHSSISRLPHEVARTFLPLSSPLSSYSISFCHSIVAGKQTLNL